MTKRRELEIERREIKRLASMERHIDGETYKWRDEVMTLQRIGEMEK
jgi:hypothetical protein